MMDLKGIIRYLKAAVNAKLTCNPTFEFQQPVYNDRSWRAYQDRRRKDRTKVMILYEQTVVCSMRYSQNYVALNSK